MVKTKRVENPIYVVTHSYLDIVKERVLGVYDSKTEATIAIDNLVDDLIQEMIKEFDLKIEKQRSDEDNFSVSFEFRGAKTKVHEFKINMYDKNYLYLCNSIGLMEG